MIEKSYSLDDNQKIKVEYSPLGMPSGKNPSVELRFFLRLIAFGICVSIFTWFYSTTHHSICTWLESFFPSIGYATPKDLVNAVMLAVYWLLLTIAWAFTSTILPLSNHPLITRLLRLVCVILFVCAFVLSILAINALGLKPSKNELSAYWGLIEYLPIAVGFSVYHLSRWLTDR
jgi:hypothetical protein